MRLLVTGFPPFAGRPVNPSGLLVEAVRSGAFSVAGVEVVAELLPVAYQGVEDEFFRLLECHFPDVVLAFGVGGQVCGFRLEQRGVNRDDAELPDNVGEIRRGTAIRAAGPAELRVAIDVPGLVGALRAAGLPAEAGDDAGRFVCNHLLFSALDALSRRPAPPAFLFTHLAPVESGMTTETALRGLHIMAGWFHNLAAAGERQAGRFPPTRKEHR